MRARYAVLAVTCVRPANRRLRKHLLRHILPGLALYQVIREEDGPEAALAAADRVFALVAGRQRRSMQRLGRFPLAFLFLRWWIRPAMREYPPEGWQIEWREVGSREIHFDIQRCFYCETLARYGAPELAASFCRMDDLIYDRVSPHFEWGRTQTIGRGAAFCNFVFSRPGGSKAPATS